MAIGVELGWVRRNMAIQKKKPEDNRQEKRMLWSLGVIVAVFFLLWIFFAPGRGYFHYRKMQREITALTQENSQLEAKNAELTKESTALNVQIAKADYLPVISLNGGLSSGYSSLTTNSNYTSQLNDKINPSLGLNLSIPIFQKKQIKTNVGIAAINVDNAELDVVNTKNQLRKEIEQACVDVISAQEQYNASLELQQSAKESYDVTDEKFKVGLLNSVDFLVQKTNLITSESKLLQSKYNLIFTLKVLDYYKGIPLTL